MLRELQGQGKNKKKDNRVKKRDGLQKTTEVMESPPAPDAHRFQLRPHALLREKGTAECLLRGLPPRPEDQELPTSYTSRYDLHCHNLQSWDDKYAEPRQTHLMAWFKNHGEHVWGGDNSADTTMQEGCDGVRRGRLIQNRIRNTSHHRSP